MLMQLAYNEDYLRSALEVITVQRKKKAVC